MTEHVFLTSCSMEVMHWFVEDEQTRISSLLVTIRHGLAASSQEDISEISKDRVFSDDSADSGDASEGCGIDALMGTGGPLSL